MLIKIFRFVTPWFLLILVSCSQEEVSWDLELPPTPILSGTTGWGVVNTSYLKINLNPDDDNVVVTTLREGDIVKIESVHYLKDERGRSLGVWYNISWENLRGWVKDRYLNTYETREKAETGSGLLLNRQGG